MSEKYEDAVEQFIEDTVESLIEVDTARMSVSHTVQIGKFNISVGDGWMHISDHETGELHFDYLDTSDKMIVSDEFDKAIAPLLMEARND